MTNTKPDGYHRAARGGLLVKTGGSTLTDAGYAQNPTTCKHCGVVATTMAVAHGLCLAGPRVGKRHFLR